MPPIQSRDFILPSAQVVSKELASQERQLGLPTTVIAVPQEAFIRLRAIARDRRIDRGCAVEMGSPCAGSFRAPLLRNAALLGFLGTGNTREQALLVNGSGREFVTTKVKCEPPAPKAKKRTTRPSASITRANFSEFLRRQAVPSRN